MHLKNLFKGAAIVASSKQDAVSGVLHNPLLTNGDPTGDGASDLDPEEIATHHVLIVRKRGALASTLPNI